MVRWSSVTGAAIAATILALAVVSPAAPVPQATNIETGAKHDPIFQASGDMPATRLALLEEAERPAQSLPSLRSHRASTHRAPSRLTREQRMRRIIRHIWPDNTENQAIRVFRCESNLNPNTVNWRDVHYAHGRIYRGSWGLAQIGALHTWAYKHHPRELLNPWRNLRAALRLYRANGWQPWSCARILGIR